VASAIDDDQIRFMRLDRGQQRFGVISDVVV
jgi:hypothetical protein